jgi:diguanylate cyclase (GGDEF)-like protein
VINHSRIDHYLIYDPHLMRFRARLTRAMIIILFFLLAAWLLTDLAFASLSVEIETWAFGFDLTTIILLGILGGIAHFFSRRGLYNRAGVVLGSGIFAASLGAALFVTDNLMITSFGFLIAIMIVGSIGEGRLVFSFAGVAWTAMALCCWGIVRFWQGSIPLSFGVSDSVFLIAQAGLFFGTAALIHTLSEQIHNTLDRLHSQTVQLTRLAHTDPLTGLANRRHLLDQLQREFTRANRYRRPLSLVYLDLDGFKAINDRFGHLFGDEILRGAATAMSAVLRAADLLARIGGDEFAVLLPETTIEGAQHVTLKLRKALSAYSNHLGPSLPALTFCAGVGQLREDDQSIEDLLARSDEAQYKAKDAGKSQTRTQDEFGQLPLFEKV